MFVDVDISPKTKIASVDEKLFDEVFNENLEGTYLTMKHARRVMLRSSRIICISSVRVRKETVGSGIYAASKAAVRSFR